MAVNREPTEAWRADPHERSPGERQVALTRAEIQRIFTPGPDEFPRSRTMKYLLGGRGRMVALGAFAGLMAVKPAVAMKLVRFLPLGKLLPVARLIQSLR